ncbi:hypothetical protein BV898_09063 [Hypsibius exemplaris]|uniref:KAT8 regulatory NSL complex subunit 2 n=1 Tax=Hypsibius exemplaris TaxID=2072580 RepID=A0A1W0WP37_HYPEX|nr:hypothetical protein BV898_09063 [Hypsibius exemplaris]
MDPRELRSSPVGADVDVEMLGDLGGGASTANNSISMEDGDPLISEVFRLTNGMDSAERDDSNTPIPPSLEIPARKAVKKRKVESKTNGVSPFTDAGSTSVPSPCSSVITSASTAAPSRPRGKDPSTLPLTGYVASKDKERNLIYVNYLNAFSNSLTVHPPWKRSSPKAPGIGPAPAADEASSPGGAPSLGTVDFETGGLRAGLTTLYLPDVDRDRCGHAESFCPFSKREGYSFCEKHLLDDKGLPFVPCAFQRLEANPCPYPARMPPGAGGKNRPQRSKEALCSLHMEKGLQEVKQHMSCSANAVFSTMDGLAAYNTNVDKGLPPTNTTDLLDDLAEPLTREHLETYLRATAKETYATCSSSEESLVDENEIGLFRSKTFDTDDELDSGEDDPLKYAHHFSVEELTRILRAKIAKQKELLAGELRLQEYKLKDARAKYLVEVAEERSFLPSVHTQARFDPESCTTYRSIRTMLRLDRKRPKFSYANARRPTTILRNNSKLPDSVYRCLHIDPGTNGKVNKCRQFSLPFSRHCLAHILEDQYQYLYKSCAATHCSNPILKSMGAKFCYHHTDLNILRSGPDLNVNDSHTQASSSSDQEAEGVPLANAAISVARKGLKRPPRPYASKGVFLPSLHSPETVVNEVEAAMETPLRIKVEEMTVD